MLLNQALLYFRKGQLDQAQRLYEESIAILRPCGDQALLADGLIFLGIILHSNGDYERARSLEEEGLDFARAVNEVWLEAMAIFNLGYIDSLKGHYAQGYEQMMTGLTTWRTLGDPHAISLGLNYLVPTLNKMGLYEVAKGFMLESIALCEQSKNRWGMGTAYRFLGLATMAAGQFREAQTHLRKSLEIFGEEFVGWDIARSRAYLGDADRMAGDLTKAQKDYLDALHLAVKVNAIPIALDALAGLSNLQEQAGETENALVLCYHILNHPSSEGETKRRMEQLRTALEARLDSKQVIAAKTLAAEKSFEEIAKVMLRAAGESGTRFDASGGQNLAGFPGPSEDISDR